MLDVKQIAIHQSCIEQCNNVNKQRNWKAKLYQQETEKSSNIPEKVVQ